MAVNQELHPKVVFKHPSGRVIGVQVMLKETTLLIVNVYASNSAKLRGGLWHDLLQEQFPREWILVGDFNMVQSQHDRTQPSVILSGTELERFKALEEKWALVDAWQVGPWQAEQGFTYHSLQYTQTASRLDRLYFSHNADWVPGSLRMEILTGESLSDHFPLSCLFSFYKAEDVKPKEGTKHPVTNSNLFKD